MVTVVTSWDPATTPWGFAKFVRGYMALHEAVVDTLCGRLLLAESPAFAELMPGPPATPFAPRAPSSAWVVLGSADSANEEPLVARLSAALLVASADSAPLHVLTDYEPIGRRLPIPARAVLLSLLRPGFALRNQLLRAAPRAPYVALAIRVTAEVDLSSATRGVAATLRDAIAAVAAATPWPTVLITNDARVHTLCASVPGVVASPSGTRDELVDAMLLMGAHRALSLQRCPFARWATALTGVSYLQLGAYTCSPTQAFHVENNAALSSTSQSTSLTQQPHGDQITA